MTARPAGSTDLTVTSSDPVDPPSEPAADLPSDLVADPPSDPVWARPALALLLIGTAIGYLWNLSVNGWANTYYAAAVQAGTLSWKAFFFGSSDPGNYITVDKPPVSLWIMELSGRVFGFSSWSMLAPEALLGVASVALLYLTVRRVWGAPAGLLAGLALAVTPVAALMFRYNNPDAALTFFMVAAAYTMTRALERAGTRWLLVTGALMGAAFLTKELQALLVVPGLALAYLVSAPVGLGKRVWQLLLTGATMAVTGLWWPVLVDLLPASSRPYVGGSTGNSVLELALGYNGLGRITGNESGIGGGPATGDEPGGLADLGGAGGFGGAGPRGGGGAMFSGDPGLGRLFNTEFGGFVGWLIPAALVGVVAVLWLTRGAARPDARRAGLILWSGWFAVTAAVFSFSQGIIHTYYGVALAPAVAVLATTALPALWRVRTTRPARALLAGAGAGTAVTAYLLLNRAPSWWPWLRWVVLVAGLLAAVTLLLGGALRHRLGARAGVVLAATAVLSGVAAPVAWSAATIGSARTGSVPGVGPAQAQQSGFAGRGRRLPPGLNLEELPFGGGQAPGGQGAPGAPTGPGGVGRPGFGGEQSVDAALVTMLRSGAPGYTWAAAARSSDLAGPLQLAGGAAVMALGGFSGSDPAITLGTFKKYVSEHKVHYYVSAGSGGFGGFGGRPGGAGTDGVSAIDTWVSATFTATTVGNLSVYDLGTPKG
jgi:4-amino-4-deoxy-L-arabinose transferase-like glycosyltransferase